MKKTIAIIMMAVLMLAMLVPTSAATTAKAYDDAQPGELLYQFNFKGDDIFTPGRTAGDNGGMDYTISETGNAVTIKANGGKDQVGNYWGGVLKNYKATENTTYSFVYEQKANGKVGKNNSVGIGGWVIGEDGVDKNAVYNNYGSANTLTAADGKEEQRVSLSYASVKLDSSLWTEKVSKYVYTGTLDYDTNADGFMTFLIVYDGEACEFLLYTLANGATDWTKESSWIELEHQQMMNALMDPAVEEYMGFWTYAYYQTTDTTIRNVKLYKETPWSCDHEYTVATVDPTCETDGYTTYTCTKCQSSYTKTVAARHNYDEATCIHKATCTVCGKETGYYAPHRYSIATCTKKATCTVCGVETGDFAYHRDYNFNGKCDACDAVLYGEVIDTVTQAVQANLDNAITELNQAIANGDTALDGKITALNTALTTAKTALESADAANKTELEGKITEACNTLDAAVKAVQKNLDDAKAELNKAITNGDTALDGKITALNTALTTAKTALESVDAANKTELEGKITEAYNTLDAAVKAVQKNLDDAKVALEAKDAELEARLGELEGMIAAFEEKMGCSGTVSVAGVALVAALGTCAVFVEKKRKV